MCVTVQVEAGSQFFRVSYFKGNARPRSPFLFTIHIIFWVCHKSALGPWASFIFSGSKNHQSHAVCFFEGNARPFWVSSGVSRPPERFSLSSWNIFSLGWIILRVTPGIDRQVYSACIFLCLFRLPEHFSSYFWAHKSSWSPFESKAAAPWILSENFCFLFVFESHEVAFDGQSFIVSYNLFHTRMCTC